MTRISTILASGALALGVGISLLPWAAALHADHGTEPHADHGETQHTDPPAELHEGPGGAEHGAATPEAVFNAMISTMHEMPDMPAASTGDVDTDFLLLMIPHHQSAVDMAIIALEQADDQEVRALAEQIIAAQEEEIAGMRALLERLGVEPPVAPAE